MNGANAAPTSARKSPRLVNRAHLLAATWRRAYAVGQKDPTMRSLLNMIFDILTLMALVIAGVGHMLPWFRADLRSDRFEARDFKLDWPQQPNRAPEQEARRQLSVNLMSFQAWHASR